MIYFDNASTTRPDIEVIKEYEVLNLTSFANPHSINSLGMKNKINIERVRNEMLKILGLNPNDYSLIFTSGATEANNLAIQGFCHRNKKRYNHIMTSTIEHNSVLNVFKHLEEEGFKVDYIKVTSDGKIDEEDLKKHLDGKPVFAAFMCVNNEIGSVNNMKKLKEILGSESILFCDLVQTIGKEKVDFGSIDMFSFTSHKIHGIKGIGCLIKRKKIMLEPLVYGGGQEDGLRSGTMDYSAICAFKKALEYSLIHFNENYNTVKEIHDYIREELLKIDGIVLHDFDGSCPYILNFSTLNKKASVIVEALSNKDIYVNSVSACYSKKETASYVIKEIGGSDIEASNTIRLSFSRNNTLDEAREFIKVFNSILESIKG